MITKEDRLTILERKRITIQGVVQGVGFRPFAYGLANKYGLAGFVLDDECGVTIEVEGSSSVLDSFVDDLTKRVPPLARVLSLEDLLPSNIGLIHRAARSACCRWDGSTMRRDRQDTRDQLHHLYRHDARPGLQRKSAGCAQDRP